MCNTGHVTYTAPSVLAREYDRQIREFGFRDRQEALIYLGIGLYNQKNGIRNSRAVRGILSCVSVERPAVLRAFPREYRGVRMNSAYKDKLYSLTEFGYLTNLMNAVMEAFLAAGRTEKRALRREMHRRLVQDTPPLYWTGTYISASQCDRLSDMAACGGMSLKGMVRSAIDMILAAEGLSTSDYPVPLEIQEAVRGYLRIEGFTLYRFSGDTHIVIYIPDDRYRDRLHELMRRHEIPGASELVRRALLFLMEADKVDYRYVPEETEPGDTDYFDENESYYNERLSRVDFARSIYR